MAPTITKEAITEKKSVDVPIQVVTNHSPLIEETHRIEARKGVSLNHSEGAKGVATPLANVYHTSTGPPV